MTKEKREGGLGAQIRLRQGYGGRVTQMNTDTATAKDRSEGFGPLIRLRQGYGGRVNTD
jgi:hypothetical protein